MAPGAHPLKGFHMGDLPWWLYIIIQGLIALLGGFLGGKGGVKKALSSKKF